MICFGSSSNLQSLRQSSAMMADQSFQAPTPVKVDDEYTGKEPKKAQTCCYIDCAAAEAALPPLTLLPSEVTSPKCQFDLATAYAALPPLIPPEQTEVPISTSGQHRQPPKMETLGHDILNCILDYISTHSHLRACLRMNKEFASLIVPRLYKSVGIHIDDSTPSRYACLLAKSHTGLKHIKSVSMWAPASGDVPEDTHRWAKAFLGRLSEGQLTYFR